MAEDLEGTEVLELILQELRHAQLNELDTQHELLESVRGAIADHPEDANAQSAAALSTLVAYGSGVDKVELGSILADLTRLVDGLESVTDVYYVDAGLQGYREFSLREHLPHRTDARLTPDELDEVEAFIRVSFGDEGPAPNSTPSRTPRP